MLTHNKLYTYRWYCPWNLLVHRVLRFKFTFFTLRHTYNLQIDGRSIKVCVRVQIKLSFVCCYQTEIFKLYLYFAIIEVLWDPALNFIAQLYSLSQIIQIRDISRFQNTICIFCSISWASSQKDIRIKMWNIGAVWL